MSGSPRREGVGEAHNPQWREKQVEGERERSEKDTGLCRKRMSGGGGGCLKTKPTSLGQVSPVVFGVQATVEFALVAFVAERMQQQQQQQNPKLDWGKKKREPKPAGQ